MSGIGTRDEDVSQDCNTVHMTIIFPMVFLPLLNAPEDNSQVKKKTKREQLTNQNCVRQCIFDDYPGSRLDPRD